MKLQDLERVNHLVSEPADIKSLIDMAQRAEPMAFQLFIEAPDDAGLRMSMEGASTTHSGGINASAGFLDSLKRLAIAELQATRRLKGRKSFAWCLVQSPCSRPRGSWSAPGGADGWQPYGIAPRYDVTCTSTVIS